ncbi:hypothetical protein VITU102760_24435 [Vibrio tubiashii]|jgi:hypothetical protein|uniref:Uncharacterized protein n=1 Tax=Vibrio tubiashii ATCC 19109 TaxID=1051646 RepID=F9T5D1_9VIBR|nr:hypothetical protein [Vibrio tubiashii]AIW17411.1 hypothetical protein IX91_25480 [Vibrio tubiashii ATCC 19109]EGU55328.1 hypothetical protein VITU9109_21319 [Vibrio tubiashii ATCC 19109]EIF04391.1 hypothetical protein VT1337_08491 [Vibrio tubiashii NCIMB 1337 = ATCC 19106]
MSVTHYNERVKSEYRTLVVAFFNAIENNFADRELSAELLLNMIQNKGLSQRDSLTADWLRARVYQPDKYANLPLWLAKAAYFCLLDIEGWTPTKDSEWFAMTALFVSEQGGQNPDYDHLVKQLPVNLQGSEGEKWLEICILEIVKIQESRG